MGERKGITVETVDTLIRRRRSELRLSREGVQRQLDLQGYNLSIYKLKRIENESPKYLNMRDILAIAKVLDISAEQICSCDDFENT